ncbi:MAG: hypothetical protein JWL81_1739 [Verrucomicrobiales bacterium]|nr:hypothetical protein [Verrucomicrobiales bacterium]
MNAIGFFIGRFAWQLGLRMERARWNAVTRETQLLAEAQDLLGKLAWPHIDSIERLSGEFWQLSDLQKQQHEFREKSAQLTAENEIAQDRLYVIEDAVEDDVDALRKKKSDLMARAVGIMDEVDEIKDRDAETRRRFTSLKGKLDVLKKQSDGDFSAEIERTRQSLGALKEEHSKDLNAIAQLEADVQKLELTVQGLDAEIAGLRDKHKAATADLVQEIGRRSKLIAETSARIGSVESQKNELSFQVGQYLSNQIDNPEPEVRKVLNRYGALINRIRHLRRSIQYNQRLARRASR